MEHLCGACAHYPERIGVQLVAFCETFPELRKPNAEPLGLHCVYDSWNRLAEVKSGETTIAKYEYDGLNRRVKKHIDTDAPSSPDGVDTYRHFYYNNAWQIVETRVTTSDPDTAPDTLDPEYQYVWSQRYIDAPILRDENQNSDGDCTDEEGDERLYYLTDANMNVTCIVDVAGEAVERYMYDPYGSVTILDGTTGGQTDWADDADQLSDVDNVILFCGYFRDTETKLYHVRHRTYHPLLGRWLQRDPAGYVDGLHLYEFVRSNPAKFVDAQGTKVKCVVAEAYSKCMEPVEKDYKTRLDFAEAVFNKCTKAADSAFHTCINDCKKLPWGLDIACMGVCNVGYGVVYAGCISAYAGAKAGAHLAYIAAAEGCLIGATLTFDCDECPEGTFPFKILY